MGGWSVVSGATLGPILNKFGGKNCITNHRDGAALRSLRAMSTGAGNALLTLCSRSCRSKMEPSNVDRHRLISFTIFFVFQHCQQVADNFHHSQRVYTFKRFQNIIKFQ